MVKLQRVVKLEPSYYQACSQLGSLLHYLGREEEAVLYLRKSFEFERGFMSGYVMCVPPPPRPVVSLEPPSLPPYPASPAAAFPQSPDLAQSSGWQRLSQPCVMQ